MDKELIEKVKASARIRACTFTVHLNGKPITVDLAYFTNEVTRDVVISHFDFNYKHATAKSVTDMLLEISKIEDQIVRKLQHKPNLIAALQPFLMSDVLPSACHGKQLASVGKWEGRA